VSLPAGELTIDGIVTPLISSDGTCGHVLGVARNITERRQTERELIRLERLHALEEMARGVAHNFNNILVGVLGYAQLIEMQSRDQGAVESAKHIVDSALRAKDLVQRLNLSVGRGSETPPERVDSLTEVVKEAIETTRPKWQDEMQAVGVTIGVEAEVDDVPAVRANPVGLHHIIVNLVSNAVDAMPEGGEIRITATAAGDWVHLNVSDTGSGMSEAVQQRIFEPFFTTRQDVGSGLGLAMTYRTVTEWGGDVEVESQAGKGTTFTVVLPVWEDDPKAPNGKQPKKGHILVVDDEWTVRQVLQRALKDYHLEVYSRGGDALDRLQGSFFDLALIDLGLPGVPGNELAEHIKRDAPDVVTVLVTGWEIADDDPRLAHFDYHIRKPFGLAEIRDLVEDALGSGRPG
jgi:nitrogen-specific signal transduction histidine kinase/CheY-like chemotaxis protein